MIPTIEQETGSAPVPTKSRDRGGSLGRYIVVRAALIIPTVFILVTSVFMLGSLPVQPYLLRVDCRNVESCDDSTSGSSAISDSCHRCHTSVEISPNLLVHSRNGRCLSAGPARGARSFKIMRANC